MRARLNKIYSFNSHIIKYIEKVSNDLILFNFALNSDFVKNDSRPLHLRYDFGEFPPLDISFDSETGLLNEITIFIKKTDIIFYTKSEKKCLNKISGFPGFVFDTLKKHEYYYDEICDIEIVLYDSKLFIFLLDKSIYKEVYINEDLKIYLNLDEEIVGFIISNLSVNEIELLT